MIALLSIAWILLAGLAGAQPANDECSTATELVPSTNAVVVPGTTIGATSFVFRCGTADSETPTVFYEFVGTGAKMRLSTCHSETSFATEMVLEDGADSPCGEDLLFCNSLVSSESGDAECASSAGSNAVTLELFTVDTQVYEVAVLGRAPGSSGNFGISLLEYQLPVNNECASAINLLPAVSKPLTTISGSTLNATMFDFPCDGLSISPVVFYEFVGSGARFRLSTCHSGTDFPTSMWVDTNEDRNCGDTLPYCGAIQSDESGDLDCEVVGRNGASLEFYTTAGVVYEVAILGRDAMGTGSFELSLLEYIRPENDNCTGAPLIDVSNVGSAPALKGSTANATFHNFPCNAGDSNTPVVFYKFQGTGGRISVTTCANETDFPTAILVETGSGYTCGDALEWCSAEESTEAGDLDCDERGYAATVTLEETTLDQVYEVAVMGRAPGSTGTFGIRIIGDVGVPVPAPVAAPTASPPQLQPAVVIQPSKQPATMDTVTSRPEMSSTVAPSKIPSRAPTGADETSGGPRAFTFSRWKIWPYFACFFVFCVL